MFIKFLQSSLFSSPSPLSIVLASPLLNSSFELIPDVPLSFCVRSTVQDEVSIYYSRSQRCSELNTSAYQRDGPTPIDEIESDVNAICYIEAVVNASETVSHDKTDEAFCRPLSSFNSTRRSSNA